MEVHNYAFMQSGQPFTHKDNHMRKITKLASALLLTAAISQNANAVPAKPGPVAMVNGGDTLTVYLHGDESSHYITSEDGYLLTDCGGLLEYATVDSRGALISTGVRATTPSRRTAETRAMLAQLNPGDELAKLQQMRSAEPRRIAPRAAGAAKSEGKGLFPGSHFPSTGEQKALVVLVEYANVGFNLENPHDYFSRLLNEEGFADYGGTGSAKDYFTENSAGQFRPQFDLYGPVKLSQDRSYYGGNDIMGNDRNAHQMVIEACEQLDGEVDFSQYDRDGDGFIDNVFVFYAGRGEASGGTAETVWPHSWNITKASTGPYIFDGVQLDYYACTNEWTGSRPDGIGTFVHEFSHVMGLPDLYPTSSTSSAFTPGDWSVMDHGPYNNNGCTPPMYSAFERYALGWAEPVVIDKAQNATLPPIGENLFGIVPTSSPNEYFLFENRQQTSWDAFIPGHGMLVWHVDYNTTVWDANRVNNNASHQYVDLEEADGTQDIYSRDADAFPGSNGITSFTDETSPSMLTWRETPLGTPLTEITEGADGLIRFKVKGGREPIAGVRALEAANVGATEFTARWEAAATSPATYRLTVYRKGEDGAVTDRRSYTVTDAASYTVSGVEPDTYYYYTVEVTDALEVSAPSEEIEVFTGHLTIDHFRVQAVAPAPEDITANSFTARWEPLADATEYHLTVYTKVKGDPLSDKCTFDNKLELPEGWSTDASATYSMGSYAGEAIPSLRLGNGQQLRTPRYADEVKQVSFWQRGNAASAGDEITVRALTASGTSETVATIAVETAKGGRTETITSLPADTEAIEIVYTSKGSGSLAIDDVDVRWGNALVPAPLEGYDAKAVGDSTGHTVEGLTPETAYYFTVNATDGTYTSLPSEETEVLTAASSGVDLTAADSAAPLWRLTGDKLEVAVAAGVRCTVYDVSGRRVGTVSAGRSLRLPSRGIYILSCPGCDNAKIRF